MPTTHIALIGEQPIPILLPARHLNADRTILVHTDRSAGVAGRLAGLIPNCTLLDALPYAFDENVSLLEKALQTEDVDEGGNELLFNLTGGTKMMALAAYALATQNEADFVYLQSEGLRSLLRRYSLKDGIHKIANEEVVPTCITIDEYLRAHVPGYRVEKFSTNRQGHLTQGGKFEKAVADALQGQVDELLPSIRPDGVANQLEIDLIIRCGNQVGIAELKDANPHGEGPKRGIDQLATICSPQYLGLYTKKFLITTRQQRREIKTLAEAQRVSIIELLGYKKDQPLSTEHQRLLVQAIHQELIRSDESGSKN